LSEFPLNENGDSQFIRPFAINKVAPRPKSLGQLEK
jgi:hypothetical protein